MNILTKCKLIVKEEEKLWDGTFKGSLKLNSQLVPTLAL